MDSTPSIHLAQSAGRLRLVRLICVAWLLASTLGCAAWTTAAPTPDNPDRDHAFFGRQARCLPAFTNQDGWYGGDAAYSVPLPIDSGRVSLWLFGDSFVAGPDSQAGRTYPFVHNTIGISHCTKAGEWSLETFWRRGPEVSASAFFVPDADAEWVRNARQPSDQPAHYWLFDGFVVHDVLFVGLLRVVPSEPRGPFNLTFRLAGMDLARIENFRDHPDDWEIQISTLSNNTSAFPGSAFVVTDSHLYAYAFFDRDDGKTPRILSRLDLDSLNEWRSDLSGSLETWSTDAAWIPGFAPSQAMILMADNSSEMSVHFDSASREWIAVYVDPMTEASTASAPSVVFRSATRLTGPWSRPRGLLSIPEMDSRRSPGGVSDNLFCYAGKAHPQFAEVGDLVVSYVCNLFATNETDALAVLEELLSSPELYRPRAFRIELPR